MLWVSPDCRRGRRSAGGATSSAARRPLVVRALLQVFALHVVAVARLQARTEVGWRRNVVCCPSSSRRTRPASGPCSSCCGCRPTAGAAGGRVAAQRRLLPVALSSCAPCFRSLLFMLWVSPDCRRGLRSGGCATSSAARRPLVVRALLQVLALAGVDDARLPHALGVARLQALPEVGRRRNIICCPSLSRRARPASGTCSRWCR